MKNKILGIALMVSIVIGIVASYYNNTSSIQYAISGTSEFFGFLSMICVILFGSIASLELEK